MPSEEVAAAASMSLAKNAQADKLPLAQALPMYKQLAAELQKNAVYIPLYYSVGTFLIHAYVQGAGSTTQADYYWNQISLLSH
jgi:ABC-type oligopeptide transport system substrate-binding subunit